MLKVLTEGGTLQEALENARTHAVRLLSNGGEVLPFQQVSVDLATSVPEEPDGAFRVAGSVTFSVRFEAFGVQVDHTGEVASVDLPGIDASGLSVAGKTLDAETADDR